MKKATKQKTSKKTTILIILIGMFITGILLIVWLFMGSATKFSEKSRVVLIVETNKSSVLDAFEKAELLRFNSTLGLAGASINLWDKMKPGKYEIKKGQSIVDIIRMLKNGRLAEVKLVLNKVRTKEDLAHLISKTFPLD
jgi:UPF0755 protein